MSHKSKTYISGFFIILTIISLFIFWMKTKEDTFADEIISTSSLSFKTSLNEFLTSVNTSINQLDSNIKNVGTNNFNKEKLNIFLSDMIHKDKYLKGIILANNNFSYVIYRDNSTWAISYDLNVKDSLVNWQRLNNKLEEVSNWTDTYNFFPVDQKLSEITEQLRQSNYLWKTAKSQMPDKRDLLSNIFQTENIEGEKIIAGLIFSTHEIGTHFSSVLEFSNPLVSIITSNNEIVTPIITSDTAVVSAYKQLGSEVKLLVNKWKESQNGEALSFSFEKFNEIYWTRIDNIKSSVGVIGFAVTISANDLSETEDKRELVYFYISLLFLLISIILVFIFFRRKKTQSKTSNNNLIPISDDKIIEIIKKGETEFVEFKSSIRWDYREEKVNKILEEVILKTIAAFTNAKGGVLFIGISDDLEILGLEKDFSTLKKQDVDYFELHTRKLINNQYGIAFSNENLLMKFPVFNQKTICLIQVKASSNPVFLKTKNKQGNVIEKFYVRSGNSSQEIASMKEVNEYISLRF